MVDGPWLLSLLLLLMMCWMPSHIAELPLLPVTGVQSLRNLSESMRAGDGDSMGISCDIYRNDGVDGAG